MVTLIEMINILDLNFFYIFFFFDRLLHNEFQSDFIDIAIDCTILFLETCKPSFVNWHIERSRIGYIISHEILRLCVQRVNSTHTYIYIFMSISMRAHFI